MKVKLHMSDIKNIIKEEIDRELAGVNPNSEEEVYSYDENYEDMSEEDYGEFIDKTNEMLLYSGYVLSNIDELQRQLNTNFPDESEPKTKIIESLKLIEQHINIVTDEIYKLQHI